MKTLIIGLGQLGEHVLENISKNGFVSVETYTKNQSQNKTLAQENVSSLNELSDAQQPDIIFITANAYKPEDRKSHLEKYLGKKDHSDFRDDEREKNQEMILDITKKLKHFNQVPVITTANPPEMLVKLIHDELGWDSVFNIQMMLDNLRIAKITGISENEYLCVGEHGRPVPTLAHIEDTDKSVYEKINKELLKIGELVYENHGRPPLEDAKMVLDKIIKAIVSDKELKCVLTVFDGEIGFGKPCIVKGTSITEQPIPDLSEQEKELVRESKTRLIEKWGDRKEITNEIGLKIR